MGAGNCGAQRECLERHGEQVARERQVRRWEAVEVPVPLAQSSGSGGCQAAARPRHRRCACLMMQACLHVAAGKPCCLKRRGEIAFRLFFLPPE